ncbi:MAG: hypothetical protein DRN21_03455, partial [Thermoplasmata archaeon]
PDGTIVNWTWSFGDGNVSHAQNPSHQYTDAGTYTVNLTVRDDDGAVNWTVAEVVVLPVNHPPGAPSNPHPSDGETGVDVEVMLQAVVTDIDGDSLTVFFHDASDDSLIGTATDVASGASASVMWSGLSYDTSYAWYAVADDGESTTVSGTWHFTTGANTPPDAPVLTGPSSGYTNTPYQFSASSTDPEGHQIRYGWDWNGDDSVDEWTQWHASGEGDIRSHSWGSKGTYHIKVKAEDEYGGQSGWSAAKTITITQYVPPPPPPPPEQYTLVVTVEPDGAGDVAMNPPGGVYDDGTVVALTAHASEGFQFNHWSGDAGGNTTSVTLVMDSDKTVVAHFTQATPPNEAPTVEIHTPSDGATVSGVITVQGVANDSDGEVQKVEVKIDAGAWKAVEGTESWSYQWNTGEYANGPHTIYARSYDGDEYSSISSVQVVVQNEEEGGGFPLFTVLIGAACILAVAAAIFIYMRRR